MRKIITALLFTALFLNLTWANKALSEVQVANDGWGEALIIPFVNTSSEWATYVNLKTTAGGLHIKFRDGESGDVVYSTNIYLPNRPSFFNGAIAKYPREGDDKTYFKFEALDDVCIIAGRNGEDELIPYFNDTQNSRALIKMNLPEGVQMMEVYTLGLTYKTPAHSSLKGSCEGILNEGWLDMANFDLVHNAKVRGNIDLVRVFEGLSSNYSATPLVNLNLPVDHIHPTKNDFDLRKAEGGIEAVAKALSASTLSNEVVRLDGINAATEWVITYPLAPYMNHKPFLQTSDGTSQWCDSLGLYTSNDIQPTNFDPAQAASVMVNNAEGVNYVQQTEGEQGKLHIGLCNAVNIVNFGSEPILLEDGSPLQTNVPTQLAQLLSGKASILEWALPESRPALPMLGFRLTTFKNGTLNGGSTLSNYSLLTEHEFD